MISFTILNFCIILCKIQGFVNVWKPKNVIVNKFYVNMPKLSADIHSYPMWKVQIYDNLDYDEQKIVDKIHKIIPYLSYTKSIEKYNHMKNYGFCDLLIDTKENTEFYTYLLLSGDPVINCKCMPVKDYKKKNK